MIIMIIIIIIIIIIYHNNGNNNAISIEVLLVIDITEKPVNKRPKRWYLPHRDNNTGATS